VLDLAGLATCAELVALTPSPLGAANASGRSGRSAHNRDLAQAFRSASAFLYDEAGGQAIRHFIPTPPTVRDWPFTSMDFQAAWGAVILAVAWDEPTNRLPLVMR